MDLNLTLLGEMITFAIFIWFTVKFVWPPLMNVMEERRKKIADGLAAAEQGERELEMAQVKVKRQLLDAKKSKKVIDNRVKALETELKLALGNNAILADNDGHALATWQNVSSRRLDSTKLSKDRPDIFDQYVKTIESRRLIIKEVA